MIVQLLKTHLPWAAPSAALVFAASGYFDRSSDETAAQQTEQLPYSVAATQTAPSQPVDFAANQQDVVTRLGNVTETSLQVLNPEQAEELGQAVLQTRQPEPVVAVVEPTPTVAPVTQDTESAIEFFANAQANLDAHNACVGDLRSLAEQARVYFPAGGLTEDELGMEQARLIGTLLQDCDGVQVIVEGHSDPSGNPAVNLRLSKERAQHIIQRLGASGLDTRNFLAEGLGSSRPSNVTGPLSPAHYDRRVEFVVVETDSARAAKRSQLSPSEWASASCVKDLQREILATKIFYRPRSVAAKQDEVNQALRLAEMASNCPNARLRVIGQHSDPKRTGETPGTGRLRAQTMMAMLVSKGIDSGKIIIAAPSRSKATAENNGSRIDFDVIID
ncbi:OmpA family protein [Planktotalea sp.]|uniref:OmpA family protein n=1 Tax=Planktotalea sp. TaxID=2029877 RepID=UPI0032968BFA